MIDLHSHVLPRIDDGPGSMEEALQTLLALVGDEIDTVAATPHVRADYPTTADAMEAAVTAIRAAAADRGIPIDVRTGGEVAVEMIDDLGESGLRRFGLAGNRRFILIEFPYVGWPPDLAHRLVELLDAGFSPVLAHPERNPEVQFAPDRLEPLVAAGVLVQLTASSLAGLTGRSAEQAARHLVASGLAHIIASDAHALRTRGPAMVAAAAALGDDELAWWMTTELPGAIAAGNDVLPPRPEGRRRRRRLFAGR